MPSALHSIHYESLISWEAKGIAQWLAVPFSPNYIVFNTRSSPLCLEVVFHQACAGIQMGLSRVWPPWLVPKRKINIARGCLLYNHNRIFICYAEKKMGKIIILFLYKKNILELRGLFFFFFFCQRRFPTLWAGP